MSQIAIQESSIPHGYQVHPLLDPKLPSHQPAIARVLLTAYRRIQDDPTAGEYLIRAYSLDPGGPEETLRILGGYCHDADVYLDDLLRLIPEGIARSLRPLSSTREMNDLGQLLVTAFEGSDSRKRYEAQRKLYLAKLFYDVDHCRSVRDAPRHKERFEKLLDDLLWSEAVHGQELELCCIMTPDEEGVEHLDVGVPQSEATRCWRYRIRQLPAHDGEPRIDVFQYWTRFKKDTTPSPDREIKTGFWKVQEHPRWPRLGKRSGSIVSKMIRGGIDDPRRITDLLGAMFIVGNRAQSYALERRLIHALGGPFRWRDRVDTLTGERDRARLGPHSSSAFRVLKQIVDILIEDPNCPTPYLFSVEIQIYPVEEYLRTLYDSHFASHTSYKRRQFLRELLPLLFPAEVFGEEITQLASSADENGPANLW